MDEKWPGTRPLKGEAEEITKYRETLYANTRQEGGDHYQSDIQHWDYVAANNLGYLEAQITKYLTRWHKKNGLQDIRKARHFLDKLEEQVQAGIYGGTNAASTKAMPYKDPQDARV